MRAEDRTRTGNHSRGVRRFGGLLACAAIVTALLVSLWAPSAAFAHETDKVGQVQSHSLGVDLTYPDEGLLEGEQLCLALYQGSNPDMTHPPLLSRCLDPGDASVSFQDLPHGEYSVLFPGPGTELDAPRYQGQLVATAIPDDDDLDAFGIGVDVGLSPDFAGTTGRVQVSVYGCPAGTDAGSDKDGWAAECNALAGGIPLTLSGAGSIEDAAFREVTGVSGNGSGRVEFTDLPPGAYELDSDLPENVTNAPALFVESSIDGSLGSLQPSDTLALRPTETVAVDVFLVLDQGAAANSMVGLTDLEITGAVDPNSSTLTELDD
jgi:hypothetical protein